MKIVILKEINNILDSKEAKKHFMNAIELRQSIFRNNQDLALCLDKYDLIADHFLIYDHKGEQLVAYLRSIRRDICDKYLLELPITMSINHSDLHINQFRNFLNVPKTTLHMGYLCKDNKSSVLKDFKVLDLMTWIAYTHSGLKFNEINFCATVNLKLGLIPWFKEMGNFEFETPDFSHPIIPDPHRLILIPNMSDSYYKERSERYSWLNNIEIENLSGQNLKVVKKKAA